MKKMVFIHGEKGGVGKSQAVIWMTENMLKNDIEVSIIEADAMLDIHARYNLYGISKYAPLSLEGDTEETGVNRIFEVMEECESDIIIVNLPAASSVKIEPVSGDLAGAVKDMGFELIVVFLSDNQSSSLKFYEKSMQSGLMSLADKTAVVNNLLWGDFPDLWPINQSKYKPNLTISMKKVQDESHEIIKSNPEPLFMILEKKMFHPFQTRRVNGWIDEAAHLVQFIKE